MFLITQYYGLDIICFGFVNCQTLLVYLIPRGNYIISNY